jgi:hypothetical protein
MMSVAFFVSCIFSAFVTLENSVFPPGSIYERFIEAKNALFDPDLRVTSSDPGSEILLLVFSEANRTRIFSPSTDFRPTCCFNSSSICTADESIRVWRFHNSERHADTSFVADDLLSVVLANCGSLPVTVSGFIHLTPQSGFLDERLIFPVRILLGGLWAMVFYIMIWTFHLLRVTPKIAPLHQLFIGSVCLSSIGAILLVTFLWFWNIDHGKFHSLLIFSGISTAFSRVLMYYLTIVGLQFPAQVSPHAFYPSALILGLIMIAENFGIADFDARKSGEWNLGFGTPSYTQFLAISVFCIGMIVYGVIRRPRESGTIAKRQFLLFGFAFSFVMFFGLSLFTAMTRLGTSLVDVRNIEWIPFVIEPLFFMIATVCNGWFWMDFNPEGWQVLESGPDMEVGAERAGEKADQ